MVRALAQEVGHRDPGASEEDSAEARARRKERTEILAACEAAARYWAARLSSRSARRARAYLSGARRVARTRATASGSASAADAWNDLPARVEEKGVGLGRAATRRAGHRPREGRGAAYDRFRERLMFPIAGIDGEVIGFGGRVLPGEGADAKGAKYINSPETPLYKKCARALRPRPGPREHPQARGPPCWSRATSTSSGSTRWA